MNDFFAMLPAHLQAEMKAAREAEAVRLEHVAKCTLTHCVTCRRVPCEWPRCSELAVLDGRCLVHDREWRSEKQRVHLAELVAAQIPETFRLATLSEPWLVELVGGSAVAEARDLVARGAWALIYSSRSGAGKTSLAAAMVRERSRRDVCWTSARALAVASAHTRLGEEPALVAKARASGLLVVDELGTEADSFGSAVADVIMDRHDLGRPVWITTPIAGAKLSERYGSGLLRRINENGAVVRVGVS